MTDSVMEPGPAFSESDINLAIDRACVAAGIQELKQHQRSAILSFVKGADVFVSLPTGYGKSLIYALLPSIFDHLRQKQGRSIVVCVSPLSALMIDQKTKLSNIVNVEFVGQEQEDAQAIDRIIRGQHQLVFISPEKLIRAEEFRHMLLSNVYKENLVALVVDEAHCVITWGEDFRVEFAMLGEVRSFIPKQVFVLALTATATYTSRSTICERLCMKNCVTVSLPPSKPNIFYQVLPAKPVIDIAMDIARYLEMHSVNAPKTIIYCRRILDCSEVYEVVRRHLGRKLTFPPGYPVLSGYRLIEVYTAALTTELRKKIVDGFRAEDSVVRVIVATVAFGMGIDCLGVRQVIHVTCPETRESYAQETGRCGRDGQFAKATLFAKLTPSTGTAMQNYCMNRQCRRSALFCGFIDFGAEAEVSPAVCCDVCRSTCECDSLSPHSDDDIPFLY